MNKLIIGLSMLLTVLWVDAAIAACQTYTICENGQCRTITVCDNRSCGNMSGVC